MISENNDTPAFSLDTPDFSVFTDGSFFKEVEVAMRRENDPGTRFAGTRAFCGAKTATNRKSVRGLDVAPRLSTPDPG
jgi:hypothetical protein